VRIIRACKELGLQTVAVYSTADKQSLHVQVCVLGVRVRRAAAARCCAAGGMLVGAQTPATCTSSAGVCLCARTGLAGARPPLSGRWNNLVLLPGTAAGPPCLDVPPPWPPLHLPPHRQMADEAVCIGEAPSSESYLNVPNLLAAAVSRGAQAVHPVRACACACVRACVCAARIGGASVLCHCCPCNTAQVVLRSPPPPPAAPNTPTFAPLRIHPSPRHTLAHSPHQRHTNATPHQHRATASCRRTLALWTSAPTTAWSSSGPRRHRSA
jgi:hypothetical protein